MRRRSLLITFSLLIGACSGSGDTGEDVITGSTLPSSTSSDTTEASSTSTTLADSSSTEATSTSMAETTSTSMTTTTTEQEPEETTSTEAVDDVALLCDAYLGYLAPVGAAEPRIEALEGALGQPAPPGIIDALDTLQSSDAGIDDLFDALDTLEGYILPICTDRYRAGLEPAIDNATAGRQFFEAINTGDRATGARLAPANVVASFEPWQPLDQDTEVGPPTGQVDGNSLNMLLGPTITVFCSLRSGIVDSCSFGE